MQQNLWDSIYNTILFNCSFCLFISCIPFHYRHSKKKVHFISCHPAFVWAHFNALASASIATARFQLFFTMTLLPWKMNAMCPLGEASPCQMPLPGGSVGAAGHGPLTTQTTMKEAVCGQLNATVPLHACHVHPFKKNIEWNSQTWIPAFNAQLSEQPWHQVYSTWSTLYTPLYIWQWMIPNYGMFGVCVCVLHLFPCINMKWWWDLLRGACMWFHEKYSYVIVYSTIHTPACRDTFLHTSWHGVQCMQLMRKGHARGQICMLLHQRWMIIDTIRVKVWLIVWSE